MSEGSPIPSPEPLVASVEMGYGHLRAAWSLARALGAPLLRADRPPLAGPDEERLWSTSRRFYEGVSRASQLPLLGAPFRPLLQGVTSIPPLHPLRDLSSSNLTVTGLERLVRRGLGRGLVARLRETGAPLLTTYFATAVAADLGGCPRVFCVATDVDLARAWVSRNPAASRIHYLVPSRRARRRLISYGVAGERILETGFPLPPELLGGEELPALHRNLAARLVRLDPAGAFRERRGRELERTLGALPTTEEGRPPLLTYAVGGAGAQAGLVARFLPSLRSSIEAGRLRLCLAAGVRRNVADRFLHDVEAAGLAPAIATGAIEILAAASPEGYFERFHERLATTDVLWTKPSELTFFAALGLPLLFTRPVGVQERYNRRWAVEHGAGLRGREPGAAGGWLAEHLADGTLAAAAWSGFRNLPARGVYRILEEVAREGTPPRGAAVP